MKRPKRIVLAALAATVVVFIGVYGYRVARAHRHSMLEDACARGDTKRAALLLRLGADPNGVWDSYYYVRYAWYVGESSAPLWVAAAGGHSAVVRLLISAGADPTDLGMEQMTARDIAHLEGHIDVVRILDGAQTQ